MKILFYNNISNFDLQEIHKLKKIRFFSLQTLYIKDEYYKTFVTKDDIIKIKIFQKSLLSFFLYKLSNIDKILYLSCKTLVKKSLLSLWEIKLENKLFLILKDISFNKDYNKNINLKELFFINDGALLLNIEYWNKEKLYKKIKNDFKLCKKFNQLNQDMLKMLAITKTIRYNSKEIIQYDKDYLELNREKVSTIIHFLRNGTNKYNHNNIYIKEFFKYFSILNDINNATLTIPIVLSSDNKYASYLYTTMISILENGYKNTYYNFYLLVPHTFSKKNENKILEINNKYKCYINFIYFKNVFENIIMKIPHITLTTYYRLLIGEYLPKEIEKCIYLDVDICVLKDLSELFLIEMKNNYIAGVVAAGYYFNEKENCERLNLPSMRQYVNAGMLVMNLKQIRKDNMTLKFLELSKKNYTSQDQDVLNVACYGKIITLPPKFNAMIYRLKENSSLLRDLYKEEDIIEANNSPYIIHYAGKEKPWNSKEYICKNII